MVFLGLSPCPSEVGQGRDGGCGERSRRGVGRDVSVSGGWGGGGRREGSCACDGGLDMEEERRGGGG